jgi:hypothetical protein
MGESASGKKYAGTKKLPPGYRQESSASRAFQGNSIPLAQRIFLHPFRKKAIP